MSSDTVLCSATAPRAAPVLSPAALGRARWATRAQFVALGVTGGAWGVHIPSVKSAYGLSEGSLSLVLLTIAMGAIASLLAAGRMVAWLGVRRAVHHCSVVMALALASALWWPGLWGLLPAMFLFGAAMSLYDVAINTEGSMLEARAGRPIMGNLHGSFSVGGMAGAILAAALLRTDLPSAWQLSGIGLLVLAWVAITSGGLLDAPSEVAPGAGTARRRLWPHGQLLILGLLIFAGMSAEGAMYDWSVLFLKQEIGMPQDRAAIGYAVFSASMALARFGGDAMRHRYPERTLLRAGGSISAVAMAVVLLSGSPALAFAGYALVGVGLAMVVPILYNASTRVPGTGRASAIATVSSIGYSGFLIGPPLIGAVAEAWSLSWALGLVVIASATLAWGSRFVPAPPPPSTH